MMKEKVPLQTTSSDSLHYMNSSLNISLFMWIILFVLQPLSVLASIGGALSFISEVTFLSFSLKIIVEVKLFWWILW